MTQPIFGEAPETHAAGGGDAGLSERELVILAALADGMSNKQISQRLWVAEQTVKFHLTNTYRKLGVRTRTEAVNAAYRRGLLETPVLGEAGASA